MQLVNSENIILDFYTYPPVGCDDWRYLSQTAHVRMLELQMLSKATLLDMANAETFEQAADFLSASEYALPPSKNRFAELENTLMLKRETLRALFAELMISKAIVKLFKTRDDFANLRLVIRRMLTKKPLDADYNNDGNTSAEQLKEAYEQENYSILPNYMQQAAEQAVLAYYQNKDIRWIDYVIDRLQTEYNLRQAYRLKSAFLLGLFRIQIDLTNIRTMLRLKFTESEQSNVNVFLQGGFVELERFRQGLKLGYEALAPLFFVTPYHRVVEAGASYLASNKSFLKLEQQCEEHLNGFLKSTIQIVTGPQPIIAFLLMKENEIRTVRLILTAKKNFLDTKLILDRFT